MGSTSQLHRKIARPVLARVRAAERLAAAERAQWGITRRMWEGLKRMVRRP